ncbi:MAG: MBL fold metallo-hydrolase [Myxococcota bacterium]
MSRYREIPDDIPYVDVDIELLKRRENYLLWVGHSTLLLNIKGKKILIDPVFSDRLLTVKRIKGLNYSLKDIMPVDYVLISHNHIDHIETGVLKTLKNYSRYLIPAGLDYYLSRHNVKNYIAFDWYESFKERELEFIFVPAQHWSQRGIFDRNRSLWGGWIIKSDLLSIYFAGDTGYFNIFDKLKKMYGSFHLSILPIGAYAPRWFSYKNHMSPYDALRAFIELNAEKMLPVHWGAFRLGKESGSEPIRRLLSLWSKEKIEEERLIALPVGGLLSLSGMPKSTISP